MRFVHTADWHIGRLFHNVSLIEDQRYVLNDLIRLLGEIEPDALIIAGDVYDRSVPAADAVRLLDSVLSRIVLDLEIPVLMIAGNHDDGDRLGFGSALLQSRGLHVRGKFTREQDFHPVRLMDEHGPVDICLLPWEQGVPLVARTAGNLEDVRTYNDAMALAVDDALSHCEAKRRVCVAHCFAAGGGQSDSERPLSVGGGDQVDPALFNAFDCAALGHLHQPQTVGERAAYSGSLLKYSFSEAHHVKSVTVIDMDAEGHVERRTEQLDTLRDVRIIEGKLDALLDAPSAADDDDYLLARLSDAGALYDALARLRVRYPNVLGIERPGLFANLQGNNAAKQPQPDHRVSPLDLFAQFFADVSGDPLDAEQLEYVRESLEAAETDHADGATS